MHVFSDFKDARVLKAVACIKNGITKVNDSYTASVLAYSLTLADDPDKSLMLNKLKDLEIRAGMKYRDTLKRHQGIFRIMSHILKGLFVKIVSN